jgi:hypothetical protein
MSKENNIGLSETYLLIGSSFIYTLIYAGTRTFHKNNINIYMLLYIIGFAVFLYLYINAITGYDNICGKPDSSLALISSLYPFSFIFLLGISLLELFPGWMRGFSNTIGMWCINLGGFKEFSYSLLKEKGEINESDIPKILLEKIYDNHIPLFNEITTNNIDASGNLDLPDGLKQLFKQGEEDKKEKLKKFIFIKELIGRTIWYILLSIITFFVAINNVLNSERCINKNSDDSSKFKNYLSSKLDD